MSFGAYQGAKMRRIFKGLFVIALLGTGTALLLSGLGNLDSAASANADRVKPAACLAMLTPYGVGSLGKGRTVQSLIAALSDHSKFHNLHVVPTGTDSEVIEASQIDVLHDTQSRLAFQLEYESEGVKVCGGAGAVVTGVSVDQDDAAYPYSAIIMNVVFPGVFVVGK